MRRQVTASRICIAEHLLQNHGRLETNSPLTQDPHHTSTTFPAIQRQQLPALYPSTTILAAEVQTLDGSGRFGAFYTGVCKGLDNTCFIP